MGNSKSCQTWFPSFDSAFEHIDTQHNHLKFLCCLIGNLESDLFLFLFLTQRPMNEQEIEQ